MSGGSMDYLYVRVTHAEFNTNSPERAAFREHLMLVSKALRSIEWNDSGDGDDQEVPNIMACISLSAVENDMLRAENERLRAERDALRDAAREYLQTLGGAMKSGKFQMGGSAEMAHFVRQAMQRLDSLVFDREGPRPAGLERLHEPLKKPS